MARRVRLAGMVISLIGVSVALAQTVSAAPLSEVTVTAPRPPTPEDWLVMLFQTSFTLTPRPRWSADN